MAETIKLSQLAGKLEQIYQEYSDEVVKVLPEATKKAAKQAVKSLRANAPRNSGAYAGSFKQKTTESSSSRTTIEIYSTKPGLPHLLEYGHAIKNQYGVYGTTAAHPHWAPAEAEANEALEEEIRKAVEGAG